MIEQIKMRRSIRKYTDRPVEDEMLVKVLEAGILAPSGSNTQPWHYIVVKSEEMRRKLAEVSHNQKWMISAPINIVCVADLRSRIKGDIDLFIDENSSQEELKMIIRDTSISIEHIVLEASELGLGTCWVAWFTQEEIRPILKIPSDKYVVAVLTIGYADEVPEARPRKKIQEILHYENW
jgi:nitroreductase